jgi:Tfp pilus assembly pilus retraction ATPase PilT
MITSGHDYPYLICSDGGLKAQKGGYGVIIQLHSQIIIKSKSRIPNTYIDLNSHRCESFIISALSQVVQIQLFKESKHTCSPIKSTIMCDNLAVVNTINKLRHCKPCLKDYFKPDSDCIFTVM